MTTIEDEMDEVWGTKEWTYLDDAMMWAEREDVDVAKPVIAACYVCDVVDRYMASQFEIAQWESGEASIPGQVERMELLNDNAQLKADLNAAINYYNELPKTGQFASAGYMDSGFDERDCMSDAFHLLDELKGTKAMSDFLIMMGRPREGYESSIYVDDADIYMRRLLGQHIEAVCEDDKTDIETRRSLLSSIAENNDAMRNKMDRDARLCFLMEEAGVRPAGVGDDCDYGKIGRYIEFKSKTRDLSQVDWSKDAPAMEMSDAERKVEEACENIEWPPPREYTPSLPRL